MSITDELREWASRELSYKTRFDELFVIADRIDAEHRKAEDEWRVRDGQSWLHGYDECHTELMEGNETLASDLERCGWVRMPKDADGEYINIGDVMEWIDIEGEVTLTCEVAAVGVDCFFAWDKANGRYAQKSASAYRHHHAPTVDDVLREFALAVCKDEALTIRKGVVEEYAAKLRLREDA